MHLAGQPAGIGQAGPFLYRQRIHVRPDAQRPRSLAFLQDADHAGAAQTPMNRVSPLRQQVGDETGSFELGEGQLGVGMDAMPDVDECRRKAVDGSQQ